MKARQDLAQKPYYRCLSCEKFRKGCGGIPTRGMDLQEWCEYMRDVKEAAHLTNADIAKDSDTSVKTIERIMALSIKKDILRATARRIELAVIGPATRHICELNYDDSSVAETIKKLLEDIEYLRKENDRKAKIIDKYLDS